MLPRGDLFIMKKSRIILVALTVLLLVALIGCGKNAGDGNVADTTANDYQTVVDDKQSHKYTWA